MLKGDGSGGWEWGMGVGQKSVLFCKEQELMQYNLNFNNSTLPF